MSASFTLAPVHTGNSDCLRWLRLPYTRYPFDARCRYGSPVVIGIPVASRDKKTSRCVTD